MFPCAAAAMLFALLSGKFAMAPSSAPIASVKERKAWALLSPEALCLTAARSCWTFCRLPAPRLGAEPPAPTTFDAAAARRSMSANCCLSSLPSANKAIEAPTLLWNTEGAADEDEDATADAEEEGATTP